MEEIQHIAKNQPDWNVNVNEAIDAFNDFATSSHWGKGEVKTDNKPVGINGCTVDGWSYTPYYSNGKAVAYVMHLSISGADAAGNIGYACASVTYPFKNGAVILGGLNSTSSNEDSRGYLNAYTDGTHLFVNTNKGLSKATLDGTILLFA